MANPILHDHHERAGIVPDVGAAINSEAGFVAHARIVAVLTFTSRLLGVVRDAVCARVFGAGPIWSAFAFAFLIPNLFRRLFGEGALSAAFLPEYSRLAEKDPPAAARFATLVLGTVIVGLGLLTVIGEVILLLILQSLEAAVTTGTAAELADSRSLVITLIMVMLPYMPLVCLVALLGAMLQAQRKFGPTAAAPIILNLCIIIAAGLTAFGTTAATGAFDSAIILVALSVVLAGIIQVIWSIVALRRSSAGGMFGRSGFLETATRTRAKRMLRLLLPMLLGLGVLQINALLDGLIASYPIWAGSTLAGSEYPLDLKSNAILFYTQRLYQFPLGVFGIAVATAIFPALARTAHENDGRFRQTLQQGIRLTFFIGLPAALGLILVRMPLATVILRGNEFTEADVQRVANVLLGYAPAIWAYALNQVLTRAFYAQDDARTPVRIALGVMLLNLILNLTLIWLVGEAGLAWSTSSCAILQTVLLLAAIRRHTGPLLDETVKRSIIRSVLATLVMGAIVLGAFTLLNLLAQTETYLARSLFLAVGVILGILSYGLVARFLKMAEPRWLLRGRAE